MVLLHELKVVRGMLIVDMRWPSGEGFGCIVRDGNGLDVYGCGAWLEDV
jgi:hypothetical protein